VARRSATGLPKASHRAAPFRLRQSCGATLRHRSAQGESPAIARQSLAEQPGGDTFRTVSSATDPDRFVVHRTNPRGFTQAFVREGVGGVPVVCVHGWPETKRIFWRVIQPLVDTGFEVIVPDLRGFGDSDVAPDGFHYVCAHAADIYALVHDELGHERVVMVGGDLGGPIIQDLALRYPAWVDRMVLFNSPLPFLHDEMSGITGTRPPQEAGDYFVRQGTDPDGLMAELGTPEARRRYVATFYTSRFWAHPGAFTASLEAAERPVGNAIVDFHTEPFADAEKLRASFGPYVSTFDPSARSGTPRFAKNDHTRTMILFGQSDHVIYPSFDRMAAIVFSNHVGPFLLRDCGHFVPWEAPGQLVSGTAAFCGDLLSRAV
jgi:pimeloyl-ACP methyl ester carboxylesterase